MPENKTENPPLRALCVSVHDVAPQTWHLCERWLQAIRAVADIPLSLLVVPAYHRQLPVHALRYEKMLEQRLGKGDELVLHGYTHLDEAPPPRGLIQRFMRQIYTQREGEFAAIDLEQARIRLEKGWFWFERRHWPLHGFVAPAWLMGESAWRALGDFPFRYTTTRRRFYLLPERQVLPSQSLVYSVRNAWRRQMSHGWNTVLCAAQQHAPLVRLGLHPPDVNHPQIVAHCQRLLENLLEQREAMTKQAFAEAWAGRNVAAPPPLHPRESFRESAP